MADTNTDRMVKLIVDSVVSLIGLHDGNVSAATPVSDNSNTVRTVVASIPIRLRLIFDRIPFSIIDRVEKTVKDRIKMEGIKDLEPDLPPSDSGSVSLEKKWWIAFAISILAFIISPNTLALIALPAAIIFFVLALGARDKRRVTNTNRVVGLIVDNVINLVSSQIGDKVPVKVFDKVRFGAVLLITRTIPFPLRFILNHIPASIIKAIEKTMTDKIKTVIGCNAMIRQDAFVKMPLANDMEKLAIPESTALEKPTRFTTEELTIPESAASKEATTFTFRCPDCKCTLKAKKKSAGKMNTCPECGASITVPDVSLPPSTSVSPVAVLPVSNPIVVSPLFRSSFTDIFEAAEKGTVKDVRYFIEEKKVSVNTSNRYGSTPLGSAIGNENVEVIRFLVDNGANVNVADVEGKTPLHWAAYSKNLVEIAKLFISKGANVNAPNKWGYTPLHSAAGNENVEFVKVLVLEGHANVNAEDEDGGTPLHSAVRGNENIETIRFLIAKGAKVNKADKDGTTPLHVAAHWGKAEFAKVLVLEGKADVNATNHNGHTPLHSAVMAMHIEDISKNIEVVRFLVTARAEAKIDKADKNGMTPLHMAAFTGEVEFAKVLILEGKADVDAQDKYGDSPLDIAKQESHTAMVQYLAGIF